VLHTVLLVHHLSFSCFFFSSSFISYALFLIYHPSFDIDHSYPSSNIFHRSLSSVTHIHHLSFNTTHPSSLIPHLLTLISLPPFPLIIYFTSTIHHSSLLILASFHIAYLSKLTYHCILLIHHPSFLLSHLSTYIPCYLFLIQHPNLLYCIYHLSSSSLILHLSFLILILHP
jgi:hypothetical protein